MINKDTKVCISMAESAGNFGCSIHNAAFKRMGLNFIYKSFSVAKEDLEAAVDGIRAFGIRGSGVTMPYKISVLPLVDVLSEEVIEVGASNTIVNDNGVLTAYNTDAYSSYEFLKNIKSRDNIYILGNGGFSRAVQYSARKLFNNVSVIERKDWPDIRDINSGVIFNCTPVEKIIVNDDALFIDCIISSNDGKKLSLLQASRQFSLYTGKEFPFDYIDKNLQKILGA